LKEAQARTFDGVPGHKRRESFSVSSTKSPTVTPRANRSAALRASKDTPPPSSYQCTSSPLLVLVIGFFRFVFVCVFGTNAMLYCSVRPPIGPSLSRSTSSLNVRPPSVQGDVNSPRRSLSRMSDVGGSRPASLQAPTMQPRQNRSAMLRVAKMANGA
jgi:hypothetical protein